MSQNKSYPSLMNKVNTRRVATKPPRSYIGPRNSDLATTITSNRRSRLNDENTQQIFLAAHTAIRIHTSNVTVCSIFSCRLCAWILHHSKRAKNSNNVVTTMTIQMAESESARTLNEHLEFIAWDNNSHSTHIKTFNTTNSKRYNYLASDAIVYQMETTRATRRIEHWQNR